LGDLVAVLVGGFPVAVEQAPGNQAFVVKTSRASLDVIILNVQIGRPAQSRDHLIQNGAGLLLVGLGAGLRFWDGGFLGRQAGHAQTKKRKQSHWVSISLDAMIAGFTARPQPTSTAPPLVFNTSPVINPACGVQRNNTAAAISSGLPARPRGIVAKTRLLISGSLSAGAAMSVSTQPGATQFT